MDDRDFLVREKTLHQGLLPSEGMHNAVCALVEPVGLEGNFFEPNKPAKEKIWLCWELEEKMPASAGQNAGKPFMLSKKYTKSLHEASTLRKELVAWRKRQFTTEELAAFDIRILRGVNCRLVIAHEPRGDGARDVDTNEVIMRAVISTIMSADPKLPKLIPVATEAPQWIIKSREENAKKNPAQRWTTAPSTGPEPYTGPVGGGRTLEGFPGAAEVSDANEDVPVDGNGLPTPF